jgi:hypothetical protein
MNIALRDMTFVPAMNPGQIEAVENLENALSKVPQVEVETSHVFHAGMYCRTVHMKKFVTFTGALIKIPTVVIISGDVSMYMGTGLVRLSGYNVLKGDAGRKQAFFCHEDTSITMLFATNATTVEEAEAEFTDEGDKLVSRRSANEVTRTEV